MDGTLAIVVWASSKDSKRRSTQTRKPATRGPSRGPSTPLNGLRGSALVVTNLIKLGGLVIALNGALVKPELSTRDLALAAFMMAGAQGLETLLDRLFGR